MRNVLFIIQIALPEKWAIAIAMMAAMEMGSVVLNAKSISGISAALAASTTSPDVGERMIAAGRHKWPLRRHG